jgi:hypothetical protein
MLAAVLTLLGAVALACAWISLPETALVPVAAGIVLALIWHLPEALQRGERAVHALDLDAKGAARWRDRSGRWHEAEILPSSYVSGWLVVVNLGQTGRRGRSLVLLPDSAGTEELRRLRVWLRWRLGRP